MIIWQFTVMLILMRMIHYETYMAFAADFNERLNAYEGLIRAISLERGIKHHIAIAVDEWGIDRIPAGLRKKPRYIPISILDNSVLCVYPPSKKFALMPKKRLVNLEDALVTGLYLNAFIRHAYSIRMANFSPMPTMVGIN